MKKTLKPMRLPALLFWQVCVLSGMAGVLASRYAWAGVAAWMVLLAAMGGIPWARRALLTLCAVAAALYAGWMSPQQPGEAPEWARTGKAVRFAGVVAETSGLPDRRVRVLLESVRPVDENGDVRPDPDALPGRLAWSWDQGLEPDLLRPLPGQVVRLTAKILPVAGFANEGAEDGSAYWADKQVWFRTWSAGDRGAATISGAPDYWAALRESWRTRMVEALGGSSPAAASRSLSSRTVSESRQSGMTQAQAILPAMIFGDRYSLDSATLDVFTRAGLVHSLALSGQHLVLAAMAAGALVWLLSRGSGGVLLRLPRRALALVLGVPLAGVYLWVGGAPPSLVRAAVMMLAGALLWLGKRPMSPLDPLFFAALCFLVAWPAALFDVSMQLSMLSVAGIILALPLLDALRRALGDRKEDGRAVRLGRNVLRKSALMLATSVAAQLPTVPVLLTVFGRVSPLFPLNLLWLPVQEVVVLPLTALGLLALILFGTQPVSDMLFALAAAPTDACIALLNGMMAHHVLPVLQGLKPTGMVVLGYAAACAAAASLPGRKSRPGMAARLALCAALLLPTGLLAREADAFVAVWERRVTLRVLDVGQGQALVLEWPGGRMLLDGGGSMSPRFDPGRDIVAHALTMNRPPRLRMVMASHGDADHARGLKTIMELFDVGGWARSALPLTGEAPALEALHERRGVPLHELRAGDTLDLGYGLALEILHPPGEGRFSSNNASLVVRLTRDGQGLALMCGDAQKPALRLLLGSGRSIRSEVLVVPHHGAASALVPEFYDAAAPRLALISCGLGNSFGFPSPVVSAALAERGIEALDTATSGEIRVVWTGDSPGKVTSFRQP